MTDWNISLCPTCDQHHTGRDCPRCEVTGRPQEPRRDFSAPIHQTARQRRSRHELAFIAWLKRLAPDAPAYTEEYQFHKTRKWRFDFAWPDYMLAVEIEGGVWSRGRHTRGSGYIADCDKYNAAALDGWCVLRFTGEHIKNDPAQMVGQVMQVLTRDNKQEAA